jgi:hypothetical protein
LWGWQWLSPWPWLWSPRTKGTADRSLTLIRMQDFAACPEQKPS